MFVLGTAGHVDHGKSTLIKAITGMDPDRLREEKERQMTIDLGFAWLNLPSGQEFGIVDVPGHRDFIENMLAGVGGIDAVLFIVAADEGVMPQTREHLAIIDLLDIQNGIIVLTKIDMIDDDDWLTMVTDEIRALARDTCLQKAEIIPVSSINRTGLDHLMGAIDKLLEAQSPKKDTGKPRLPIDRIFTLKGFGTIVTGTLLDGHFNIGQQVVVLPQKLETRIRGLQIHKKHVDTALPGSRTAVNLTGVEVELIRRGDVVAAVNTYDPTKRVDIRFKMLKDVSRKLVHNEELKFFTGTTQTFSRVRLIGLDEISAGQAGWLQLEFNDDIVVRVGDHCILRRPSPPETIGGGTILDAHPGQRHRRFSTETIKHFEIMEFGDLHDKISGNLEKSEPLNLHDLARKLGLSTREIEAEVQSMIENGEIIVLKNEKHASNFEALLVHAGWINRVRQRISCILNEYHGKYPLRMGMKREHLKSELALPARIINSLLTILHENNSIKLENDFISLTEHQISINYEQNKLINKLMDRMHVEPYSPPSFQELAAQFGEDLVCFLIDSGELVRTSDQVLFDEAAYEAMVSFTNQCLSTEGKIEIGTLRDAFKTSRKYVLSFLEYLDKIGHTERNGDFRVRKPS